MTSSTRLPQIERVMQSSESSVLFLDIDDVLCLSSPYGGYDAIEAVNGRHGSPDVVYRGLFARGAVQALKRVNDEMKGCVRYVISSTWRERLSRGQLEFVFRRSGLDFVADRLADGESWRTPEKFRLAQRVDEIAQWLKRYHRGEPFAVVDDTHSGASLLACNDAHAERSHPFVGRVVLCREFVGLNDEHVSGLLDALRREVMTHENVACREEGKL